MNRAQPAKTLVHGFDTIDCSDAMHLLQSKGFIVIKAWIGDSDICSINIIDLFNARVPLADTQMPSALYKKLYENIHVFDAIFARHSVLDGVISVSTRLNIFNILANYLYNVVMNNKIELMLFSNIPHEGPDFLLYEIARNLNIKTIICVQSLFPNSFFMVRTLYDFGIFDTSESIGGVTMERTIESLKPFEKPLFYMKGTTPLSLSKRIRMITAHTPLAKIRNVVRQAHSIQDKAKSLNPVTVQRAPDERTPSPFEKAFNIFFSVLTKSTATYEFYKYTNRLNKLISRDIDLTKNYIYFPLHLQPELTTVPLGYEYFDQALALEELHSLLPSGWKIFLKENPKQTEFMRDPYFFKRLEALDNLVWVPRDYDSHALIRSCKILATVTGTAGWEALLQKKPVIVFGSAWYKHFPHVFTFSRDMDLLSLSNVSIDINGIYKHLNMLQNKMGTGIVDPAYNTLVDNYSTDVNCRQLFESIHRFLVKQ